MLSLSKHGPATIVPPIVWGATCDEVVATYPCDAFAPHPDVALWRAIDVDAPPAVLYRWLQQLRVAPYSYDLLDNFALPSPRRLTPRAAKIAVGQRIMHVFRVLSFEPGATLTIGPDSRAVTRVLGALHGTYVVTPRDGGSRLVVKVCCNVAHRWYGRLYARVLPRLDLFMMRKQLLTLKAHAERSDGGGTGPSTSSPPAAGSG